MNQKHTSLFQCVVLVSTLTFSVLLLGKPAFGAASPDKPLVLDSILATVNGKPVTLSDLRKRLGITGSISPGEVSSDPKYRYTLEALILEQLIEAEAASRRISVSNQDIDAYTAEVAARNNLSPDGFVKALQSQGHNLEDYKARIRGEILKSRVSSAVFLGGVSISEQEIDKYLESHPELIKDGSHVRLSRILVERSSENAKEKILTAREAIKDGASFAEVASRYSEAPEAASGGSLGLVAEKQLHPAILEQIMALDEDEVTDVISTDSAYQIFLLEERADVDSDDQNEKLREEVRAVLSREKQESRIQTFFSTELPARYLVDRKI